MSKMIAVIFCLLALSCARAPLKDPLLAFRRSEAVPDLRDSYSLESLREALGKTLAAYDNSKIIPAEFHFADRTVSREDYRRALQALQPELVDLNRFQAFVWANFDFFEVYGADAWGEVFSTGYYDVTMKGSKRATAKFTEPLYRTPPDLVSIDLKAFADRSPEVRPLQDLLLEQKSKNPTWRGRILKTGPIPKIIPYYERTEIQRQRPLSGNGLELAYVDPIDAFFLEIQGSGTVELGGGRSIRVGYDSQNGGGYVPIGKFLLSVIPLEQMSMQRIRQHLESLTRDQQQEIFDKNPSFVFFKEINGEAVAYCGAEVTAMRTIASDQVLFPKGTLGFLDIDLPVFADPVALDPSAWEAKPRWVFDQDTGGAIHGGGRIDLFMGKGVAAERAAGVMKRKGRLWYVAPKQAFLDQLNRGEFFTKPQI